MNWGGKQGDKTKVLREMTAGPGEVIKNHHVNQTRNEGSRLQGSE